MEGYQSRKIVLDRFENGGPKRKYDGANIRFFMATRQNELETQKAGRPIYDEIESIEIQWPGHDRTVRKIEETDIREYPELYERFKVASNLGEGAEGSQQGTPLKEWSMLPRSACEELVYLGFRTVEQLSNATDDVKRKMGPLQTWVKKAGEWVKAAKTPQADVVALKEQVEKLSLRNKKQEEQIELLLQRIEGNEGTSLSRKTQ